MKVKVIQRYNDLELKKIKEPGETFEASKVRADILLQKGFAEEVKEPKLKKEEPEKK